MDTVPHRDRPYSYVSTGHLPPPDHVAALVEEAHERFKSNCEGRTSSVYPATNSVNASVRSFSLRSRRSNAEATPR